MSLVMHTAGSCHTPIEQLPTLTRWQWAEHGGLIQHLSLCCGTNSLNCLQGPCPAQGLSEVLNLFWN